MAQKQKKDVTEKPTADKKPEGEKKPRAARADYGFKKGAKITLTKESGDKKYRGKRLEYFEILKKHDGKVVEDFEKKCPPGDPPRGWLRFFVQDGAVTLSGGVAEEKKPAKEKEDKKDTK